jgi:bifunctional non-homologous end joining protein LigD
VDWSQNDQHKTTVSVYSLRARERPTVSTPVTWDEVEKALKKKDPDLLVFQADQTIARVEKMGDLFEPLLTLKQKLPSLSGLKEEADEGIELAAAAERPKAARSPAAKKPARKSRKV